MHIKLNSIYDHTFLHVGQFVLPIDAGCFTNAECTELRKEAADYIREMRGFPHLSDSMKEAIIEGFVKKFCMYRYN